MAILLHALVMSKQSRISASNAIWAAAAAAAAPDGPQQLAGCCWQIAHSTSQSTPQRPCWRLRLKGLQPAAHAAAAQHPPAPSHGPPHGSSTPLPHPFPDPLITQPHGSQPGHQMWLWLQVHLHGVVLANCIQGHVMPQLVDTLCRRQAEGTSRHYAQPGARDDDYSASAPPNNNNAAEVGRARFVVTLCRLPHAPLIKCHSSLRSAQPHTRLLPAARPPSPPHPTPLPVHAHTQPSSHLPLPCTQPTTHAALLLPPTGPVRPHRQQHNAQCADTRQPEGGTNQ